MSLIQTLDPTELTCLQASLKHLMDELERDPNLYQSFSGVFTFETLRSIESKINGYIESGDWLNEHN
jgi:hypothetical protein